MIKKLTILVLILVLSSCTIPYQAETSVNCPCLITNVSYSSSGYQIKANSISNQGEWIIFYTTEFHQLGDTIK